MSGDCTAASRAAGSLDAYDGINSGAAVAETTHAAKDAKTSKRNFIKDPPRMRRELDYIVVEKFLSEAKK
jgi:hypothetical protein